MNEHAKEAEQHVDEVVEQLDVGDDFREVFLKSAMISHQTDDVDALHDDLELEWSGKIKDCFNIWLANTHSDKSE